ncbi:MULTISPECIES: hypothetical protein [Brevibacillus]|jgi:hypothetical protein|uniref:hypothetical protein n=1 Tax=Brevibacillus TaxID=55080 RepID=UPI00148F96A6|nr:hypothetical protein [Brevibacillus borstelensis]MCM3592566.1 hypothetical protein [Brevibacillus borstelensis]MCM3623822.1 hypothetical protein [Brevibacillus borstelensis]MED1743830.1 hypothetical protein [Brevibacillus borstelensis]NOU53909.1 hypothetical protein [Brevibacillus borstelensis]
MNLKTKWALSAIVYLLLVIGGYQLYTVWAGPDEAPHQQSAGHAIEQGKTHLSHPQG